MQQQVTRVLTRARTVLSYHPLSSSQQRGGLFIPGLQNHQHLIKSQLHEPYYSLRHLSLATVCRIPPLRALRRLQWTTINNGRKLGLIVGLVVGTRCLSTNEGLADIARCENDQRRDSASTDVAEWDYRQSRFARVVRMLWAPSLCVLTISLSWQYPVTLIVNLLFLMWSTKPSPSSIYLWVEQMRQDDALKTHGLERMKAQAAGVMHVEVRDNILFCLARVTSLTKSSTLVGFLGDWWLISSSSSAIDTGVTLRNFIPSVGPFKREQFSSL